MTTQVTQIPQPEAILYLAFELSNSTWMLGFSTGLGQKPRERTIDAGDLKQLKVEIERAKERFGLGETTRVISCYEAGRDGFWIHRALFSMGIENKVIDSASIEVNRRARRAKTDSLDVQKLLILLIRYTLGERKVMSIVNVPTLEQEDNRQLHRELKALKKERTQHINRIKGFLAGIGIRFSLKGDFMEIVRKALMWDGQPIPPELLSRIEREAQRKELIEKQIKELEKKREEALKRATDPTLAKVRKLLGLKAVGLNSAWLMVMEFFSWREFKNRREVGALAGLVPSPYQSGESSKEQGISKSGNRHIRAMLTEIAWLWLRYQPNSRLSQWFQERFAGGNKRMRKVGIVALSRKLLIALWRYVEFDIVPEGAQIK